MHTLSLARNGTKKLPPVPVISIIDDDEKFRLATRRLVRSLGYDAVTFATAESYLRSDRLSEFACVITDLHMPGMSGLDLQKQLIAGGRRTPIIFMTAFYDEMVRKTVLDAGALGFLKKPFGGEDLIECLGKALSDRDGAPTKQ